MGDVIQFRGRAQPDFTSLKRELADRLRGSLTQLGFPNLDLADRLADKIMEQLVNPVDIVFQFSPRQALTAETIASLREALDKLARERLADFGIALVDGALLAAEVLQGHREPKA